MERKNLLVPNAERWPADPARPVIELEDVSLSFGPKQVLKHLNLKITAGQTTVIVGRSGSGKSVLLKLMIGLIAPTSGKVRLFGRDLSEVTPLEMLELRKRMGMLFQNYALFDALSVEQNIGFTLTENSSLPRREISQLSRDLIEILRLTGSEHALPSELSGGMKKRVALARALVANPEVVLFDEPTTGLDPIMIENVDEMIVLAKERYQITSVIISHDMASTRRLSDRVGFLHDGRIIFFGTYDEMVASELPPIRRFFEGASTTRLAKTSDGAAAPAAAAETQRPVGETPVIELVGVHKRFGGKHVLRGIAPPIFPRKIFTTFVPRIHALPSAPPRTEPSSRSSPPFVPDTSCTTRPRSFDRSHRAEPELSFLSTVRARHLLHHASVLFRTHAPHPDRLALCTPYATRRHVLGPARRRLLVGSTHESPRAASTPSRDVTFIRSRDTSRQECLLIARRAAGMLHVRPQPYCT